VPGIPTVGELSPRFRVFRSDQEGQPIEGAILNSNELREILALNKRPDWSYVFEYHLRLYSYSEFKRLVESGEIV
jgi:hypothetical protein